jgi:hypothetical protein
MKSLLNPESPQKLMYTLYIVDWLGRPARLRRHSGLADAGGVQVCRFFSLTNLSEKFSDIF